MAYPIEKKLVVAVASSALFDLTESDKVFRTQGLQAYKEYQRQHENEPLEKGVAFPFVKRLLRLNMYSQLVLLLKLFLCHEIVLRQVCVYLIP